MQDILYTIARTAYGSLIKANDALKGEVFTCVTCFNELILKKSERRLKRPHFAHKHLTQNCTPESVLHFSFKTLLFNKILNHLQNKLPLEIEWQCTFCGGKHKGNLLKKAISVKLEYNLTVCTPDIVLLNSLEKPFAVIEIIVTHSPEDSSLKFYDTNNIILIQFNVRSDKDIHLIDNEILIPSSITFCFNPKCKKCGNIQFKDYLIIVDINCWKCNSLMKMAVLDLNHEGPESFNDNELKLARQENVLIQTAYSRDPKFSYLANFCTNCHAFFGMGYLMEVDFIEYFNANKEKFKKIDLGFRCVYCSY